MKGRLLRVGAAVTAVLLYTGCGRPFGDDAADADHSHAGGGVVTHWADEIELFVEYPPHVRDVASDPWAIHLTWLADWKPVQEGRLTLLLRGPGGVREEIVLHAPARPGVYTATPLLSATGTWRADMTFAAGGREHVLPVGQFEVFESEDALPHDLEQPPPDLIALTKEQQWSMPFGITVAEERRIPVSIPAAGEIAVPPAGLAHVSTLVAGLVMARGPSPSPGDAVQAGQTLALIAPASANDSYARLRTDADAAEREAARAERLFSAGAIAERRLEEARHELEVALAVLEAVESGRPGTGDWEGEPGSHVYRLRSPIAGVVADRHVAPGQHVGAGTHAFTVVNPATLWFVARVSARHADAAGRIEGAWFTVEGGQHVYASNQVVSVGSVIDPGSRTLPVRFAVPNRAGHLKVGMLAEGYLFVGAPMAGVAVPVASVQEEEGLSVVYAKVGGEAFQRRVVETGPSDGSWILVFSGVSAGEQVVVAGAYQVKLASLGDAGISDHGHPH